MKNNSSAGTPMAAAQKEEESSEEPRRVLYPLDPNSYKLLDEIGRGVSAIVCKAICIPMNNSTVAVKAIDLDRSRADFDNVRREAKTMSLLSHPNILSCHCSFSVDRSLWVVMPFMSAGSVQSIIASSFPDGISEPCIAIVLRETLNALSYLHNQGHLHRDVKAGNILIDSNGSVKLADFGVSASIYESNLNQGSSVSSCSSSMRFTELTGTPYWMAPEVIHSHSGYSFKADIWSFGITALELAHGRPPLSHLPPSKSLLMKITKRFRFSDYDNGDEKKRKKKFSRAFKDMVGLCLDQDPSKRPSAEKLLKHSFFKNCKQGPDFLVRNFLQGLPDVEQRFKVAKIKSDFRDDDDDQDEIPGGETVKHRRISGWNFNVEGFEMEPVLFQTENQESGADENTKQAQFLSESSIQEGGLSGGDHKSDASSVHSSPGNQAAFSCEDPGHDEAHSCEVPGQDHHPVGNKEAMLSGLLFLKKSLEEQRAKVMQIIASLGGAEMMMMMMMSKEQLMEMNEELNIELENEKRKSSALETELEFLKAKSANL